MTGTEKKRKFIINIVYTVILIALFYLFFKYALGTILPILCAIIAAMILQKPVNFICKKTPLKRGLVSALSVLFGFGLFISALVLIAIWVGSEFKGFFQYIMIQFEDIPALVQKIENYIANAVGFLPEELEATVMDFVREKLATLTEPKVTPTGPSTSIDLSILSTPLMGIWNTAKQIPTTLVSVVVAVVTCCFMTADFENVKKLILGFFAPETRSKIVRAKRLLFPSLGKMAKAYGIIITITFCELS